MKYRGGEGTIAVYPIRDRREIPDEDIDFVEVIVVIKGIGAIVLDSDRATVGALCGRERGFEVVESRSIGDLIASSAINGHIVGLVGDQLCGGLLIDVDVGESAIILFGNIVEEWLHL